jgi:hypothetical protein
MQDQRKKLTPWLILLIVQIGPLQLNAANVLRTTEQAFRPLIPEYPFLSNAIIIYQSLMIASMVTWLFTAWVVYRRDSGTLFQLRAGYLVGAAMRILGGFTFVLIGGFPAQTRSAMSKDLLPSTAISLLIVIAWWLYLTRSQQVREIYS